MDTNRYTSVLYCNDQVTGRSAGDDLTQLTIRLISRLDCENSYAYGEIRDNLSGQIVHRCRKASSE